MTDSADVKKDKIVILLIEDDGLTCDLFNKKLASRDDVDLHITSTSDKTKEILKEVHPTAILLDLTLKGENGLSILKWVRDNPDFDDVMILVFSNSDDNEDIINSKNLGADDFLLKANFTIEEVLERIEQHMGDRT